MKTKILTISMITETIQNMALEIVDFSINGTFRPRKVYKRYFVNLRHLDSDLVISIARSSTDPIKYFGYYKNYKGKKVRFPYSETENCCTLDDLLKNFLKDYLKQIYLYEVTMRVN